MPTVNTGMVYTYKDLVGIKVDISELITTLDPSDVPLLNWMPSLKDACTNTKHEWIEDSLVPMTTALSAGVNGSVLTLPVTAGTGWYFKADDVIKLNDEVMIVTGNPQADNVVVVARGLGSTTGAAALSGATITRIGVAKAEGADASEPRYIDKTKDYNHTQIFEDTVKVSGTREAVLQYGVDNEYAYQMAKVLKQRAIMLEQAMIHGVRTDQETTTGVRTMGGFLEYCSVNKVDAGGAAITKGVLDDLTQAIWRAGGSPRTLVMNIDQKNRFFDIYENQIRRGQGDQTVGGSITTFENELGTFEILLDRWVPRDKILVIDKSLVGLGPLRGRDWSHEYMGKKGDYMHGQVLGEFTMECRGKAAHGVISNLAL